MPRAKPSVDLSKPTTHAAFGGLVGVSRQVVGDLQARGVISEGQTAGEWLQAYCQQLREAAAGRGGDNTLAGERARLAREQADRAARENAIQRKEYAPVSLLEAALADMARQVATRLEALVPLLRRRCPGLDGATLRIVEEEVAGARTTAAAVTLFRAETADEEESAEA